MRENKVIYGLIGYGGMGRWHKEILSNVPEIEIGGIYDIKEEKRIEVKEKGFSVYGSEEEMLSDPVSYTHLDVYKRQGSPCVYSWE